MCATRCILPFGDTPRDLRGRTERTMDVDRLAAQAGRWDSKRLAGRNISLRH